MCRRRRLPSIPVPPVTARSTADAAPRRADHGSARPLGFSPGTLQWLLCVAGEACCVAMAMPQVHIVAYCGDLGLGSASGARMLSRMLSMGIISRLASCWLLDRNGGLRTLRLGTGLQRSEDNTYELQSLFRIL